MFYSAQILARKGPLGIIWIAAHHDKKYLKKQQVSGTDILESCDRIISPEAPLALRLSGQLMLGVVRIYNKQVEYLELDAQGALVKLRQSQWDKPADVDLPPESLTAAPDQINLPDTLYPDVLLGSGLDLDPGFSSSPLRTPRGGTPLREPRRHSSIMLVDDASQPGSDLFGPGQHYGEPQVFEDVELDNPFYLDEPERARAAPPEAAAANGAMGDLGLDATPEQLPPPDEGDIPMPDAPEEQDLLPTPASGPLPASPAGADSPAAAPRLPSIEPFAGGEPGSAGRTHAEAAKQSTGRRQRQQRAARAPQQDNPTKLSSKDISGLMKDRAPILRDRGPPAKRHRSRGPLPPDHVAVQSGAAADSLLFRPAISETMAAALFAPFRAAMGSAPTGMPPPPPRLGRQPAARDAYAPQAEDGVDMTPQANGHLDALAQPDDADIPLPDAMDYHPDDDIAPPTTGPGAASPAAASPSGSRRQLSLQPTVSGSVLGELEADASNAGRVRQEVDDWLQRAFAKNVRVREAVLAPRQGLLKGKNRLYAARAFFEALQLQKDRKVVLRQQQPLGPIAVEPAANWERRHSMSLPPSQSTAGRDSESQLL